MFKIFEKRVEDITKLKIEKQNLEREAQHWQDLYFQQQTDISNLMDKIAELQEYKEKIEKLPEYESWVAGFNCGGYHD